MRRSALLLFGLVLALATLGATAHAESTASARKKCAPISGPAYKGSKRWNLGVDKIACAAGALAAKPVLPVAAKTRTRKSVKNGSFSCLVYPGGAECKGKGGHAFGVASTAFAAVQQDSSQLQTRMATTPIRVPVYWPVDWPIGPAAQECKHRGDVSLVDVPNDSGHVRAATRSSVSELCCVSSTRHIDDFARSVTAERQSFLRASDPTVRGSRRRF